jgi:glycosyltransferase involved in cell wall biosynthesis
VDEWVKRHLAVDRFDVIVGRHVTATSKIAGVPGQPMLVDADDLDYRYPVASPGIAANGAAALKRLARRRIALRALRRFDHVWFGTERDIRQAALLNASLAPNFLPDAPALPTAVQERPANRLLFVGALWYEPNRDGIDWFLAHCWPGLKAARSDVMLRIVGAGPAPLRERWNAIDGVACPGFVDDIALEYRDADVVIAPIRCGGGFQIKVLESLVHARPAVVTPFVAEGFGSTLTDGEAVAIEATPEGFVQACLALLRDGPRAAQMGAQGRAVAGRHYTRAAFEHAIRSVVERVAPAQ